MKKLFTILILLTYCVISIIAQVIVNPVFDKTTNPRLRIEKVSITTDTTFIYCSFFKSGNEYCDSCNEGYYLSEEDKTQCKKFETDDDEIHYPELSEKEAFDKIFKEMGLRNTLVKNVYCQQHNPKMPKGDYRNQVHFVWNNYKRKMIPIKDL